MVEPRSIRWKKIRAITLLEPRTVRILKKEALFSKIVRFLGFNPFFLVFKTSDDARAFVDAAEAGVSVG